MKKTITTAAIAAMVLSASVAMAADPVCGDVTDDGSIKTTDALLVLKKAVAQPITLDCSAYDDQFSACETSLTGANADLTTCNGSLGNCISELTAANDSLSTCNSDLSTTNTDLDNCQTDLSSSAADLTTCEGDLATCEAAPVCGDGLIAGSEECDFGTLGGETCVTQGFAGGTLRCGPGCTLDTSDCYATRFDASGDTIIDHETGLEWEKKDSAGEGESFCPGGPTCANPHDVDNIYQWSSTGTAPDGAVFTDFLVKLNAPTGAGSLSSTGPTVTDCYAGHCDWRLPTIEELTTVPWPAVSEFQPDAAFYYWSASTAPFKDPDPTPFSWGVYTKNGSPNDNSGLPKANHYFVRAVRSGS